MKVGTIVEMLISIKDDYDLMSCERLAVNEACNILEEFSSHLERGEAEELVRSATK